MLSRGRGSEINEKTEEYVQWVGKFEVEWPPRVFYILS